MQPEELELLLRAQNGEWDAFEQMQAYLEPPIRRFIRRLLGPGDVEDDIVQDTFIALFRSLKRIAPEKNLRAYVFRIARNRCYDELRYRQRYDTVSLDEEPEEPWLAFTPVDNGTPPDDLTHWLLLNLEVQQAMERLPQAQREALILYAEHDLSYAEIAEVTNCSLGTAKSRVFYARKNLRGLLRPQMLQVLEEEFGARQEREKELVYESDV